ncbi:LacI family DNA-binding transcriptional regulator [Paenarthrobacter sp. YIM B13468]|uniref:LacI family DNA-binding transcriptional regulator n=1 Tax=Paenarthrobacter sp. YIM B13468 TaxID=3366295 RepID=UPI00366D8636
MAKSVHSRATIYDVARMAGVHPSTVSRAFSTPGRVNTGTKKRIDEAAAELKYLANPFARALPTGRTTTLGLLIPKTQNPAFYDVICAAQRVAASRDYALSLQMSSAGAGTRSGAGPRLMETVDGLLLVSPDMDDDTIRELADAKPIVLVNREVQGVPSVLPDISIGLNQAFRSLAASGHREIAFVAAPGDSWMSRRRWEGASVAATWLRLRLHKVYATKDSTGGGRGAARSVRACGATAVVADSDLLAIGLMQELQAAGLGIPDHLSIIGSDDILAAEFTSPPLSTIRSSLNACAAQASALLLDIIHGASALDTVITVETEFVMRGSSGRLNSM